MTSAPLSAETVKNFLYASTATVSMQMLKRGFRHCAVNGVRPLNAKAARLVGPARAVIEDTPAGHVLVIATEGNRTAGTLGDILALRLKVRGVAGVLSDG